MYMDGQEKEKIRYLEAKYGTDMRHGLLTTEVSRRAGESGFHNFYNFTEKITEEKKRIRLQCVKLELEDPLFFFLIYINALAAILEKRLVCVTLPALALVFLLKIKRALRHEQKITGVREELSPQVRVLRDGLFKKIPAKKLVRGDVIRLCAGEAVPEAVISLRPPFRSYLKNMKFTEKTGRAVVAEVSAGLTRCREIDLGKTKENLMLWEIFAAHGIVLRQSFFQKNKESGLPAIRTVILDEAFFPGRAQCIQFREFVKKLYTLPVSVVFFTECKKEEAIARGRMAGVTESSREVVDREELLLLKGNHLRRQAAGIRVYCGLSVREKERVKAVWQEMTEHVLFLTLPEKEKASKKNAAFRAAAPFAGSEDFKTCLAMPGREIMREADCTFGGCSWQKDLLKYLRGEQLIRRFFDGMQRLEEKILAVFITLLLCCIGSVLLFGEKNDMELVFRTGVLLSAGFAAVKELALEAFRGYLFYFLSEKRKEWDFSLTAGKKESALPEIVLTLKMPENEISAGKNGAKVATKGRKKGL